jgi:hypothetical protein
LVQEAAVSFELLNYAEGVWRTSCYQARRLFVLHGCPGPLGASVVMVAEPSPVLGAPGLCRATLNLLAMACRLIHPFLSFPVVSCCVVKVSSTLVFHAHLFLCNLPNRAMGTTQYQLSTNCTEFMQIHPQGNEIYTLCLRAIFTVMGALH